MCYKKGTYDEYGDEQGNKKSQRSFFSDADFFMEMN